MESTHAAVAMLAGADREEVLNGFRPPITCFVSYPLKVLVVVALEHLNGDTDTIIKFDFCSYCEWNKIFNSIN
ncbi:hypothetical protein C0J52_17396 [Blattella germanica]|nr:hypothetical protein C0J52_17396 [Blattella germanica]